MSCGSYKEMNQSVSPVVGLEPGDALFHPHTAALVKAGLHRPGWAHTGQAGRGNLEFDESPDRGLYFIFGRIMQAALSCSMVFLGPCPLEQRN